MSVPDIREQMLPAKSRKALGLLPSVALSSLRAKARESERIIHQEIEVLLPADWMRQFVFVEYVQHMQGKLITLYSLCVIMPSFSRERTHAITDWY